MSLHVSFAPADQVIPTWRAQRAESDPSPASESRPLIPDARTTIYDGHFLPPADPEVLDRLAKALGTVGIARNLLEPGEENTTRLALIAKLLVLPLSPNPGSEGRRPPSSLPKWRLKRVVEYIEANISDEITLANLAGAAGMSRMYFASQFRAATGIRPHEYVLRKRIERAQHLLRTTSDALVEVALAVGFQTQAHFTTIFKRIVGTTPYQWRREQTS